MFFTISSHVVLQLTTWFSNIAYEGASTLGQGVYLPHLLLWECVAQITSLFRFCSIFLLTVKIDTHYAYNDWLGYGWLKLGNIS